MIYYYETNYVNGVVEAENDIEAVTKAPKNSIVVYRESEDGQSMVIVFEKKV